MIIRYSINIDKIFKMCIYNILEIFIGFNVETVEYKNIKFTVWDVGGQDKVTNISIFNLYIYIYL